mmetsp:Transcript_9987/g.13710  ORF Transcript_9987/g.13710 Transcript_9987/m.13710 type:complete len:83 (-) Transcript_9987:338-586(-)
MEIEDSLATNAELPCLSISSASIPPTAPASKTTAKSKAKKRASDLSNEVTIYHDDNNDGHDGKSTNGPSQRSRSGDMTKPHW